MTNIINDIAELRALAVPELVVRYREAFGREPRVKHAAYLWKRVAWKLQERRLGGLSKVAKARLETLIAEIDLPLGATATAATRQADAANTRTPTAGTVLVRMWHGREIRVQVLDDGRFEYSGITYRSLSAVAKAVTGSHWNGRLFFGLTGKRTPA
jgi:hypothetical protein